MTINMGDIKLDDDNKNKNDGGGEQGEEGSDGAVFEGDEEEWKTEFDAK